MNIGEIIEEFKYLDSWEDKYAFIIELGKDLPGLAENEKIDLYKIKGCASQVWLICEVKEGKLFCRGDSDSIIVKGLIGVLLSAYNYKKLDEIDNIDIENMFDTLGLKGHLSPNRSNGFFSMVNYIKSFSKQNSSNI